MGRTFGSLRIGDFFYFVGSDERWEKWSPGMAKRPCDKDVRKLRRVPKNARVIYEMTATERAQAYCAGEFYSGYPCGTEGCPTCGGQS